MKIMIPLDLYGMFVVISSDGDLMGSNGGWMVIYPLAVWLFAKIIIFKGI